MDNYEKIKTVSIDEIKELPIMAYISFEYKNGRTAHIIELENDDIIVSIENTEASGRNPQQNMRLSRDSFVAVLSQMLLYAEKSNMDLISDLARISGETLNFVCSDNLDDKPIITERIEWDELPKKRKL